MRYLILALIALPSLTYGQCTSHFHQGEAVLDINLMQADFTVGSNMIRYDDNTDNDSGIVYPSNLPYNISVADAMSFWLSSFDTSGEMGFSGVMYTHPNYDFIYKPGPVKPSNSITAQYCDAWDRIWKVNKTDIDSFLNQLHIWGLPGDTNSIPSSILYWPGNSNPLLSLETQLAHAPFVDRDSNGIYNPMMGDFPCIKGDQSLYWVMNDVADHRIDSVHQPTYLQVEVLAYASDDTGVTNSSFFIDYNIYNTTQVPQFDIRLSNFFSGSLGCFDNDYFGCDTSRNLLVLYNGMEQDPDCLAKGYGANPPIFGVRFIEGPSIGLQTGKLMSSAGLVGTGFGWFSDPLNGPQYYNYQRGRWTDGVSWTKLGGGRSTTSDSTTFLYPSSPSDTSGWSQCHTQATPNPSLPGHQTVISTAIPFNLAPGEMETITVAYMMHDSEPGLYPCPNFETSIGPTSDSVKAYFDRLQDNCGYETIPSINSIGKYDNGNLYLYPNPVNNVLSIKGGNDEMFNEILIYSSLGQEVMRLPFTQHINIAHLQSGSYFIRLATDDKAHLPAGQFLKY